MLDAVCTAERCYVDWRVQQSGYLRSELVLRSVAAMVGQWRTQTRGAACAALLCLYAWACSARNVWMSEYARRVVFALPAYAFVVFCCFALANVGVGLATFPECPHELVLLQQDLAEARAELEHADVFGSAAEDEAATKARNS
ncbi:hypothetical protein FVE85_5106 [Porphyridium purpureum]|uniref:Dolichol-phosphate mannosyltransferase subunit 3 n=1 Tax=Porphyridium purpureum TaxID=35688 RepID=A0A5J4Z0X0_PORPP|nr:hypothetical protein FVE85_5106 [Porphyridium purpureum]|eukprot:POR1785..scf295_1